MRGCSIVSEIKPGRYRHFKGNEYDVIGIVRHSESLQELVLYRAGIEFIEPSDRVSSAITDFIEAVTTGRRAL